jgi:hypothetical protein
MIAPPASFAVAHGPQTGCLQLTMTILDFTVTPRDIAARQDLSKVQANVMASLQEVGGVSWQYNDPGAQAVIIRIPSDQLAQVRSIFSEHYMVDPNAGLTHL